MPRTLIHLVRHAQAGNAAGLVYGRLPGFHLSSLGRTMASALGTYFEAQDVRVVLASPLERAQETAGEIARAVGREALTDVRLTEAANRFQGAAFGPAYLVRHPTRLRHFANPLLPTWGEHYSNQAARMYAAMLDARARVEGAAAVLVSHQAPIWSLRCRLAGRPPWGRPSGRMCALASVTTLTFESGHLVSIAYAEPFRFT